MAALRDRVDHLERENLELRQQAGYWKSRHRDAMARIGELEHQVEQLRGQKRQLQADLFGRRSDPTALSDRSNDLDDPQDDTQLSQRKRGQQPGNPGPKRRDYSCLPAREEFVELPHEQCVCPACGQPFRLRIDTEDSEQIEIDVCAHRRVIHRRRYERTCTCQGNRTRTAPLPPKLIPKGCNPSRCKRLVVVRNWSKITVPKPEFSLYYHHGKSGDDFQCPSEVRSTGPVAPREGAAMLGRV